MTAPTAAIVAPDFEAKTLAIFEEQFAPLLEEKAKFYAEVVALVAALPPVTDAASLAVKDEWQKDLLRERDALEEVRTSGPGALNRVGRKMGARFKPLFDALDVPISNIKAEVGGYVLAEQAKQAEQYQAAAAAHVAGDHGAAQVALAIANDAETNAPKGTTVRKVWAVKRYEIGLMLPSSETHPGLIPDEQAIGAYLRKLSPHEEPGLPGVICELVPAVSTRRA
jgi:hypothetical protein